MILIKTKDFQRSNCFNNENREVGDYREDIVYTEECVVVIRDSVWESQNMDNALSTGSIYYCSKHTLYVLKALNVKEEG